MSIRLEAFVLLKKAWKPDLGAIMAELDWRYPQAGRTRVRRDGATNEAAGTIYVDGAPVEIALVNAPYPAEQLNPPMRLIDREGAIAASGHSAYILVSVTSPSDELDWIKVHAALLTLVTTVVAVKSGAVCVFWSESWACITPEQLEEAAGAVMRGEPPVEFWVSFAQARPARVAGEAMSGIASFGLRPFVGRELEIAPIPAMPTGAVGCLRAAARRLLTVEWEPWDRQAVKLNSFAEPLTVRFIDAGFMRRGVPAMVLIAPDASVDAETLGRKPGAAEGRRAGVLGRLFRRV